MPCSITPLFPPLGRRAEKLLLARWEWAHRFVSSPLRRLPQPQHPHPSWHITHPKPSILQLHSDIFTQLCTLWGWDFCPYFSNLAQSKAHSKYLNHWVKRNRNSSTVFSFCSPSADVLVWFGRWAIFFGLALQWIQSLFTATWVIYGIFIFLR